MPLRTRHNYLSGEREPSADFLTKISTQFNINLNWLLLEKGNVYLEQQSEISLNSDEKMLLEQYRATIDSGKKILRSTSQLITDELN